MQVLQLELQRLGCEDERTIACAGVLGDDAFDDRVDELLGVRPDQLLEAAAGHVVGLPPGQAVTQTGVPRTSCHPTTRHDGGARRTTGRRSPLGPETTRAQ